MKLSKIYYRPGFIIADLRKDFNDQNDQKVPGPIQDNKGDVSLPLKGEGKAVLREFMLHPLTQMVQNELVCLIDNIPLSAHGRRVVPLHR